MDCIKLFGVVDLCGFKQRPTTERVRFLLCDYGESSNPACDIDWLPWLPCGCFYKVLPLCVSVNLSTGIAQTQNFTRNSVECFSSFLKLFRKFNGF